MTCASCFYLSPFSLTPPSSLNLSLSLFLLPSLHPSLPLSLSNGQWKRGHGSVTYVDIIHSASLARVTPPWLPCQRWRLRVERSRPLLTVCPAPPCPPLYLQPSPPTHPLPPPSCLVRDLANHGAATCHPPDRRPDVIRARRQIIRLFILFPSPPHHCQMIKYCRWWNPDDSLINLAPNDLHLGVET